MDVIIIFNGLGNQMSQFAFYLQKRQLNSDVCVINFCNSDHNGFELVKLFDIKMDMDFKNRFLYLIFRILLTERLKWFFYPIKKILNYFNVRIVKENFNYSFNNELLKPTKGIRFFIGGWHHPDYFKNTKTQVLKTFKFKDSFDVDFNMILNLILKTNSVSIHIRRGDYLNSENINLFGDVCNLEYYYKAIEYINNNVIKPYFFVFSNDYEWIKENFNIDHMVFVSCNTGLNSWRDMSLMSKCKHNIIANSSFSWWGAYLNQNRDKIVVCPDRFLKYDTNSDIYLKEWIHIEYNGK